MRPRNKRNDDDFSPAVKRSMLDLFNAWEEIISAHQQFAPPPHATLDAEGWEHYEFGDGQ